MSAFDRCKNNIIRDMAASKTHTAESWARIMLENTAHLTKPEDQAKFWEFLMNPYDMEDIPKPVIAPMQHSMIDQPAEYTAKVSVDDDEKSAEKDVVIVNTYFRNGGTLHITSKPAANTKTLESSASPVDQMSECGSSDGKTDFEIVSTPSERSGQKQDSNASTC